jgi:hypothetical protein
MMDKQKRLQKYLTRLLRLGGRAIMGNLHRHLTLTAPCAAGPLRRDCSPLPIILKTSLRWLPTLACLVLMGWLTGCSFRESTPTRTPFPTWTPTPVGQQQPAAEAPVVQVTTPAVAPPTVAPQLPADTPTVAPPTATDTPVATPTPAPTDTPAATSTPEPTATPAFSFTLEAAEKFPTDSLAANVVRVYLYVYSPTTYGLADYTLQVLHNGTPLTVEEVSTGGIPEQTRNEPGPYTRFFNMSVVFVEPQTGRWEVQLLDPQRTPVGPPAAFDLTADERTRELYVRYQQQ